MVATRGLFRGIGVRQEGAITQWNDERGFGFIDPAGGGARLFVHISELPRGVRPSVGATVTFLPVRDDRKRLRATKVQWLVPATRRRGGGSRGVFMATSVAIVFFVLLGVLTALRILPPMAVGVSAFMSLLAFVLYRFDKSAALLRSRRIPERTLHVVSLLGGWPGALVAQQVLRHKTLKQPFRTVFWFSVVANCSVFAWLAIGQPVPL